MAGPLEVKRGTLSGTPVRPRPTVLTVLVVVAAATLSLPSVPVPSGAAGASPTTASRLAFVSDAHPLPPGIAARPLEPNHELRLTVTLRPSDPVGMDSFLAGLSDPASPEYRHFVTYPEFVARFAPTPSESLAIRGYFAAHGGHDFASTSDRFALSFAIAAGDAAGALSIDFSSAVAPSLLGFAADGTPHLPDGLARQVASISGLSSAPIVGNMRAPAVAMGRVGASPDAWVKDGVGAGEAWFLGSDYASAFHAASLFPPSSFHANATFPNRSAVATLLMSGYNASTDVDLPPYDPVVVDSYFSDTFPAAWPHPLVSGVPVNVSGVLPPSPAYFAGLNDTTDNSVENSLDLEMAGSMAPGATIVNFYFSGSLFASSRFSLSLPMIADAFSQTLAAALSHNYSPARLTGVSGSFGLPDTNNSLWNTELAIAQGMGVTVLAASGDQGNAPTPLTGRFQGQWPTWPGSAAFGTYGTVAVGGSTVTLDGVPTEIFSSNNTLNVTFDASVTAVVDQSAWYNSQGGFGNISGTEGGISTVFPEPPWQFVSAAQPSIVNATVLQGFRTLGRAEPDVAFPGDATIAYVARDPGGTYFEVLQGTSVAAPLLAGLLATWTGVSGHPFGFLDPELYRIASYYEANPMDPTSPFLDVSQGGNYLFSADAGWDATTGWGGLDAVRFLASDANASIRDYAYTGPTPGLPPPFAISPGTLDAYLLVAAGITIAVVVVLVLFYSSRRTRPSSPYPPGAGGGYDPASAGYPSAPAPPGPGPWPPPAPGALPSYVRPAPYTFLCPYCGGPRPAEPTKCPHCGRL